MLSAIFAFLEALPGMEKLIASLISSYQAYQSEKEKDRIDQSAKDAQNAKTDEDLKRAAEEAADASRKL